MTAAKRYGDDDETKTTKSRELVTIDKTPLETLLKHSTRETIRGCGWNAKTTKCVKLDDEENLR